jgi:uncharacterized protein (TIGR02271 family)
MRSTDIPRNAAVLAHDGKLGRIRHIIVDPTTSEITELVVEHGGRRWLIPAGAVAGVEGKQIRVAGDRAQFEDGGVFRAEEYEPLDAGPGNGARGDALQRRPQRLQLKEEVLRVTKTEEPAGVVRVSTRVTERTETVVVPLRETRLVIEVVPGGGRARVGDRELREGESIELVLSEERLSVSKDVVVREDVLIRTESVEREERVEQTLRREELVVDQEGDLVVQGAATGAEAAQP